MNRIIREPMAIEYDDNRLAIVWDYAVSETKNGSFTQHSVTFNSNLIKLTGIRQAIFLCKTETPGIFRLTTKEPPEDVTYKLEKLHSSNNHPKFTLSKQIIKTKKGDKIRFKFYPREEDDYGLGGPKIELEIYEPERLPECSAAIVPRKDKCIELQWQTDSGKVPSELKQFMTIQEEKEIRDMEKGIIALDPETNEIKIEE